MTTSDTQQIMEVIRSNGGIRLSDTPFGDFQIVYNIDEDNYRIDRKFLSTSTNDFEYTSQVMSTADFEVYFSTAFESLDQINTYIN